MRLALLCRDTHELLTNVAAILIEEGLGDPVVLHPYGAGSEVYDRVANGSKIVDANMEVWPSSKLVARSRWTCKAGYTHSTNCSIEQQLGISGSSAQTFAAPKEGGRGSLDLDYWKRYTQPNSAVMRALPPADFSVPSLPRERCRSKICSADGRFYPSVCGGDARGILDVHTHMGSKGNSTTAAAAGCKAYFHGSHKWDEGAVLGCKLTTRSHVIHDMLVHASISVCVLL